MESEFHFNSATSVALIGKPGSGKSKFAKWLANRFSFSVFDMGDILRSSKEQINNSLNDKISTGKFVSTELCFELLRETFTEKDISRGFIIVGFPRSIDQLSFFNTLLEEFYIEKNIFLVLDIDDNIARTRAKSRKEKNKKIGKIRSDDSEEVFEKRLVVYRESTEPLVDLLKKNNNALVIDAARMKKREVLGRLLVYASAANPKA